MIKMSDQALKLWFCHVMVITYATFYNIDSKKNQNKTLLDIF